MVAKKQTLKDILKEWLSPTLLIGLIVTILLGYGKLEAYIQIHTFSTPEIKVLTEQFIKANIGIAGRENLEAQNELTKKYVGFTAAIDTLYKTYTFVHGDIELNRLRNEAILNFVHSMDSVVKSVAEDSEKMRSDVFTIKTFNEALLIEIRRLKSLENFNGD